MEEEFKTDKITLSTQSSYIADLKNRLDKFETLVENVYNKSINKKIDEFIKIINEEGNINLSIYREELLKRFEEEVKFVMLANVLNEKGFKVHDEVVNKLEDWDMEILAFLCTSTLYLPILIVYEHILLNREFGNIDNFNKIPIASRISVEELYAKLKLLPEKNALHLIKMIPCSSYVYDCLVESYRHNNKSKFKNIIYKEDCDIRLVCGNIYYLTIISELFSTIIDSFFKLYLSEEEITVDELFLKIDEIAKESSLNFDLTNINQVYQKGITYAEYFCFLYSTINFVLNTEIRLLPVEHKIINHLISSRLYEFIRNYNNTEQQNNTVEFDEPVNEKTKVDNIEEFTLPDDYFIQPFDREGCISVDGLKDNITHKGVKVFTEFIKYIAKEGYIENNFQTMNSFAYRLTGRNRPDNLTEKIQWNDVDTQSACLYYIVKYFFSGNGRSGNTKGMNNGGKYEKMKKFFECYADVSNDSAHFKKANKIFTDKLNVFFGKELTQNPPKNNMTIKNLKR